ncbi:membrane bound O-acyl transferase family-domain-containing protein [Cerioporus squamosus]|nr:membrane bound O-acyl transferase family-domain-containing protein [Cerioporus squamosus]
MLAYTLSHDANYGAGSTVFGLLFGGTTTLVLLTDPMKEVRYIHDPETSALADRPLYQRIWLAACLLYNLRGVGTNVAVTTRPTAPFRGPRTRRAWYIRQGLRLVFAYLVNDICEVWITQNQHVYPPSMVSPRTHVVPEDLETWKRALGAFAFGGRIYATLTTDSIVISVVTVALGMHTPEDWPDLFGSISHAYTVRRFWGYTWHHAMQRHFRAWGTFLVRALHIPRRTRLSSLVQLHIAFVLSAFQHALGDLMVGWRYTGRSMPFFLLNGVAITIEDLFLSAARSFGAKSTPATKLLGYIWVVLWLGWSAPLLVDWMMEADLQVLPVPVSPTSLIILPVL